MSTFTVPLKYADKSSKDSDDALSPIDIKRLFFIWFNSISNDGKNVNETQFHAILRRIFTSSLDDSQINTIFLQCCPNQDNMDYHQCLAANHHTFSNIMYELLENDLNAISMLQSIPNTCSNNPAQNTLQQILYDQV